MLAPYRRLGVRLPGPCLLLSVMLWLSLCRCVTGPGPGRQSRPQQVQSASGWSGVNASKTRLSAASARKCSSSPVGSSTSNCARGSRRMIACFTRLRVVDT
jgi:hypothetical protein